MGIKLQIFHKPRSAAKHIDRPTDARARLIHDMKASLVEMFGNSALAIARSQPTECDVGGGSGVSWCDLVESFWSHDRHASANTE